MELVTKEAARLLGVSQAEASRLARSGQIEARQLGRLWVLDADAVQLRRRRGAARGRIWSQRIALATITLLAGENASGLLSASELSRLRKSLRTLRGADLARLTGNLVEARRLHVGTTGKRWIETEAIADDLVVLTSESALHQLDKNLLDDGRTSRLAQLHVACSADDLSDLLRYSRARAAQSTANVVLHVVHLATRKQLRAAGVRDVLAALLLSQNADARVRESAQDLLDVRLAKAQAASTKT